MSALRKLTDYYHHFFLERLDYSAAALLFARHLARAAALHLTICPAVTSVCLIN
jgi:hypothetical protein